MRRHRAKIREIKPDIVYNDPIVGKFINCLMWDGKKSVACKIFYDAMKIIEEKTKKEPLSIFKQAIENVKPTVEVRPRRVGGATYQVPVDVREYRQISLAIRWIIYASREKKGRPMREKLAEEIMLAAENKGGAVKRKETTHKMAEANRAFLRFA